MRDETTNTNALECLLFAAKEPVPVSRLAEILQIEATDVPRLLDTLDARLQGSGLQIVGLAGGYALATRPEYAEWVQILLQPDPEKLSVQGLETLAIIAYNQPLTRPEIDEIRGVNSAGSVNSLITKGLVRVAGRRDAPGRPFLLETTPNFLSVFGLSDLGDLPAIGELRRAMEEKGVTITDDEAEDLNEEPLPVGEEGRYDPALETDPADWPVQEPPQTPPADPVLPVSGPPGATDDVTGAGAEDTAGE